MSELSSLTFVSWSFIEKKMDKKLRFTKISATGNDFILIDNRKVWLTENDVPFFKKICQRRTGVGADGVLLINESAEYDFELRYFNADGSEAECGNGGRAAAFYAHKHQIAGEKMAFHFGHDVYDAEVAGHRVKLKLPAPFDLRETIGAVEDAGLEEGGFINTGVPHYVLFVQDVAQIDVFKTGRKYRNHTAFQPAATNVNFVELVGENAIKLRTYERGVEAETLACGTGCVASAVISNLKKALQFPVNIQTQGGEIIVHKDTNGDRFLLEGEVTPVYEGELTLRRF